MNTVISFLVTKTGILRWLCFALAGMIVHIGWVNADQADQIGGAILLIVTGAISWLIDYMQKTHVKDVQAAVGVTQDGYLGPETKQAVLEMTADDGTPVRRATLP